MSKSKLTWSDFFSPPDFQPTPKPFDSADKFIPLTQMNDDQIHAFSRWYSLGKPYEILREEFNAAITDFRAKKAANKG
jgi:hypothetical protein